MKSDLMKQSTTKHSITEHSTMIRSSGEAQWVYAAKCRDFETNNVRLVRVEGKQIALFKTNQGYRACDNRCPHEGYPLSQGSISEHSTSAGDCILTCNWHNWKFDLNSGDNLFGGDQLRTYPMEVRDQGIWGDIAESPYAEQRAMIEKVCVKPSMTMNMTVSHVKLLGSLNWEMIR